MALQIERRDGTGERSVLVGMIVSRQVLGPVSVRWESGLFPSRHGNLIAGWCVQHYRQYGRAPHRDIVGYFDAWAETAQDTEVIQAVESLLASLSDEYERLKKSVSPDYLVDVAARLFNRCRLAELSAQIEADLDNGHVEKAEERATKYRRVELGLGAGIEPLNEEEAMRSAFEQRGHAIVTYDGALENFFGPSLGRDQFVAFQGKEKIGKSFWLQDLAYRGVCQGRNVVYFETGDMSQPQVLRRFAARAAGRPLDATRYEYPTVLDSPGDDPMPHLVTEWREERRPLSPDEATQAMRRLGGDAPGRFKLSCHPNSSISVSGIETLLDVWERDGFHPDVIVIDYADILAPLDGHAETRDQINATWKALRALSQKQHCLVVTATQSDAASYDVRTQGRANFSEDKRKYSHVTGMVGLNQTDAEKNKGLYRLNWIVLRELEFSERKCAWCASCLPVANPAVLSTF